MSQPHLTTESWLSMSALQHLLWGLLTVTRIASHFQLSTTTFHIPYWDHEGKPGHESLLRNSEGSLRPAMMESNLACFHLLTLYSVCNSLTLGCSYPARLSPRMPQRKQDRSWSSPLFVWVFILEKVVRTIKLDLMPLPPISSSFLVETICSCFLWKLPLCSSPSHLLEVSFPS
jgi:hypothetical protein